MSRVRTSNVALVLFGTLIISCAYLVFERLWQLPAEKVLAGLYHRGLQAFYFSLLDLFRNSILTIPFWGALGLTLGLQRLVPAKPEQKLFSPSFVQDLVWFLYETVLRALIVVTYVELLMLLYAKYFSFLTITSLRQTPGWLRFLVGVLLVDFLYWSQHYCNHKVPFLWRLHSLHHSQRELNFFTDFRYHVLEYVVRQTFLVIPLLILRVDPPVIVFLLIFQQWYSRFYHGNIRTNLGILRYVLVTPQSHRIHHSVEPEHRDTNFGAIFSIWDFALGTQYRNYEQYPDTGIPDQEFPHETTISLKSLLLTPFHQLVYPFSSKSNRSASYAVESRPLPETAIGVVGGGSSFTNAPEPPPAVSRGSLGVLREKESDQP